MKYAQLEEEEECVIVNIIPDHENPDDCEVFSIGPFENDRILVSNIYELEMMFQRLGFATSRILNLRPEVTE
jgi:hypothetical protein